MLEFNIRNQEISRIDNFSPAEKSVEYLIVKFNFKTEDWNEATKRAIFRNVKSKVEKDTMLEDDFCIVPWEVLVGSSDIEVSVHGVIGTEEITTNVAVFNLSRTLQGGSATQEPSPTVYEQMTEMVKETKEIAQSVRTDADNGKFNGPQGPVGKDGKSAYEIAVAHGFEGSEEEWLESLQGENDGKDNSDATVTTDSITKALGYTPANAETVSELQKEIANVGSPTDEQITSAVNDYIEENGIDVGGLEWGVVTNGENFELSTEEEPTESVPCTGITLDKTTSTINDLESTVTLTATVEPFDTTDDVIWSIDNEEVATLSGGVVTPVADGNAVVTVTCGSYSATCEITVKIIASYTKSDLVAYYDLTQYEDGYTGEVEDLSGNGNVPTLTGQENYTTGRNGFIGGKFMINPHRTSGSESTFTIPNVTMATSPFSIEMYAHLRDAYNIYAVDGTVEFSNVMGTITGQPATLVAGTNVANSGVRMMLDADDKTFCVIGSLNVPNFSGAVENLQVDNYADNEITDVYHHIVYCIGATEQKIYCDGVLVASNTSSDYTTKFTTINDYKLFEGIIKADLKLVRVYNTVLTDEQVTNNYSHTIGVYGSEA